MMSLTICQPYAHLILLSAWDLRHKRCENRTWDVARRYSLNLPIPLLIHAGKSRSWLELDRSGDLDLNYDLLVCEMDFGAIVGVAEWFWCGTYAQIEQGQVKDQSTDWLHHEHAEGPYCLLLRSVKRFPTPIPYMGRQGLFNVPDQVVADQLAKAVPA